MIRIFLPPEKLQSEQIVITGDKARHLSLVLRVQPGEKVVCFDGKGYRYECTVTKAYKKEVRAVIDARKACSVESPLSVMLAQGLPKTDKMDMIIQKSTELGIGSIIPLFTEYCQIRHTEKIERWRKIAIAASQQSGRNRIPYIHEPVSFEKFISQHSSAQVEKPASESRFQGLIFIEGDNHHRNLKPVLCKIKKSVRHIILLVGPEGGFSKQEVTAAVEKDFIEVSLGPRILRTETAPLAALSIIQYELGDMG